MSHPTQRQQVAGFEDLVCEPEATVPDRERPALQSAACDWGVVRQELNVHLTLVGFVVVLPGEVRQRDVLIEGSASDDGEWATLDQRVIARYEGEPVLANGCSELHAPKVGVEPAFLTSRTAQRAIPLSGAPSRATAAGPAS